MKVAIVGTGTMGMGIAQAFAQANGYDVTLCVAFGEKPDEERKKFEKPLKKLLRREKITQERYDEIVSKVDITDINSASKCELVIECVVEDEEAKIILLRKLHEICDTEAIIATNTSSLSITELSSAVGRPLVGMHFFNPAAVMKLVEVIAGLTTPTATVEKVIKISADIGKVPVEVAEGPGFVVNRLLIPMINEAIVIAEEGLASVDGIDQAMKLGANHPMGPLALGDLVGLDVCLAIMEVMYNETKDLKYRPARLLKKMVRANYLGQKTGKGFYEYDENRRIIAGSALQPK